uniref:thrombospondin type-1 domain-containing protein 7A-like n=1 Tax=Myxine glutinosa TaxID=7769 RepID=UPI0035902A8B
MKELDYEVFMMDSNPITVGVYSDMRSSCYVPCPGECLLEEWSEWGPCHAACFGDQLAKGTGLQVRTRGVVRPAQGARDTCRADLWETQDCTGSKCFSYSWQSGTWRGQRREVWCQQSDGVNVTGGCAESARPVSEYICKRSCLLPNSFCAPGGMCACEDGYQAIHTPRGDLEHCRAVWPRGTRLDGTGPEVAVSRPGRERGNGASDDRLQSWPLQPYGPDGRLSTWVWGVAGAGLVLLAFLVCMICLACRQRRRAGQRQRNHAPPAVAFDCDADL